MMNRLLMLAVLLITGCASTQKQILPNLTVEAFGSGYRSEARSFQDCMRGVDITEDSAGGDRGFTGCRAHDYDFDGDVDLYDFRFWSSLDPSVTPDSPASWLVLFNRNNPESEEWKNWYLARWNIPPENAFGLDVPDDEKIDVDTYLFNIYNPIRSHLRNNPELNRRIMGIVVGFRVPGNFDMPAPWSSSGYRLPNLDGGGGYSVASALMNMGFISGPTQAATGTWRVFPTGPNKHFSDAYSETPLPIPNRFTLGAGYYFTARLDGPTLESVKQLTPAEDVIVLDGFFYHDAFDPDRGEWKDLTDAQKLFPDFPWRVFNSDTEGTPNAAFRASWHSIVNWDQRIWDQSGSRFLAMEHNSFGATTVRSTTAHNNRFVPVALFIGGYKSAFGATAEPTGGSVPEISTLWYHLIAGKRLGVAAFMATPHPNWMWELIGDPMVRVQFP